MDLEQFKNKLKSYKESEIIITKHAELQAFVRGVDLNEVKENIIHSEKLVYIKEQKSKKK